MYKSCGQTSICRTHKEVCSNNKTDLETQFLRTGTGWNWFNIILAHNGIIIFYYYLCEYNSCHLYTVGIHILRLHSVFGIASLLRSHYEECCLWDVKTCGVIKFTGTTKERATAVPYTLRSARCGKGWTTAVMKKLLITQI
jgi:hypothetical protein